MERLVRSSEEPLHIVHGAKDGTPIGNHVRELHAFKISSNIVSKGSHSSLDPSTRGCLGWNTCIMSIIFLHLNEFYLNYLKFKIWNNDEREDLKFILFKSIKRENEGGIFFKEMEGRVLSSILLMVYYVEGNPKARTPSPRYNLFPSYAPF